MVAKGVLKTISLKDVFKSIAFSIYAFIWLAKHVRAIRAARKSEVT